MHARPTFNYIFHWYAVLSALSVMFCQHALGINQVCSFNFTKQTAINAMSKTYPGQQCEFILQAPRQSNIVLNFTQIFGFESERNGSASSPAAEPSLANTTASKIASCLPDLQISKLVNGSETAVLDTVCQETLTFDTALVFHTNSSGIRVVYQWLPGTNSGFILDFSFHQRNNICKLSCDGQGCPKGSPLVCSDGAVGCEEGSEKTNCNIIVSPPATPAPTTDYIPIIVIIVPVVFILGTCVVSYYRVVVRVWRDHHPRDAHSMEQHRQLHPQAAAPSSGSNRQSTTVYVPASTQARLQRQLAAVREKPPRLSSRRREPQLDLPPHISISEDGEEGFAHYQRLLQRPLNPRDVDSVRPPPNRTVYDGESPPSYHSNSAIALDQDSGHARPAPSADCNGWSVLLPCRKGAAAHPHPSSSVSNLVVNPVPGHQRRSRHASGGGSSSGSVSNGLDRPPPDYSVVMASEGRAPVVGGDLPSVHGRTDGHL